MVKKICTIIDDYQNAAKSFGDWDVLSDVVKMNVLHDPIKDEDQLYKQLKGSDIIVAMRERTKFTHSLLSRLPKLKLLITSGMRNASIDIDAAHEMGIKVCGTKSYKGPPTELTWALILGLARNIVKENTSFREGGRWQSTVGTSLNGKTLGLLGLGEIGSRVAKIAKAFDMKVVAWSQNLDPAHAKELGVEALASKENLFLASDFISIHLVLSERTRGLVTKKELSLMKKTAYLINTSRSHIVRQDHLLRTLTERKIAGAGIDVFDVEPLGEENVLRTLDNVLATPHLGYVADQNYEAYFGQAIENIQAYLAGNFIRVLGQASSKEKK